MGFVSVFCICLFILSVRSFCFGLMLLYAFIVLCVVVWFCFVLYGWLVFEGLIGVCVLVCFVRLVLMFDFFCVFSFVFAFILSYVLLHVCSLLLRVFLCVVLVCVVV